MIAVRRLVARAQRVDPAYGSGVIPAGTHVISRLLHAADCHVIEQPLGHGMEGIALPGVLGKHLVVLNSTGGSDHDFVLRHELKHVMSGEVAVDPVYLTGDSSEMDWAERTADLFALADLVPGEFIRRCRRQYRRSARLVLAQVRECIEQYAVGWSEGRLEDRAYLRLRLFIDHGM